MSGCDGATGATGACAGYAFVDDAEQSGTFRSPPRQTLSDAFWSCNLTRRLPVVISKDGVEVTVGEIDRIRDFLTREFPTLTEEGLAGAPLDPQLAHAKRWYLSAACDLIEMRKDGETIGVMIGAPEDWSTYYLRIYAVAPRFQRPILTRRFYECVVTPLIECGVQRVVTDTSPTNTSAARRLAEMQFHITGQQLSERYGPLIRYTKFLDPAMEAAFVSRFAGSAPPRATRPPRQKGGLAMKKKFALASA